MSNRSRSVTRTTSYTVGTVTTLCNAFVWFLYVFFTDLVKSMCCYLVTLHFNKSQRWLKCHENVMVQTLKNKRIQTIWNGCMCTWSGLWQCHLLKPTKNGWLINSSTEDHRFCLLSTIYCKIIMYFFPPLNLLFRKKKCFKHLVFLLLYFLSFFLQKSQM